MTRLAELRQDIELYHKRVSGHSPLTIWLTVRYAFSFRLMPVVLIRVSILAREVGVPILPRLIQIFIFLIFGLEYRLRCRIGGGFFIPHTHGVVIGARAIGRNCVIFQGVTLGAKSADIGDTDELRPVIQDDVVIGAGAKVLGPITIGSNCIIGANAVVTRDVAPGSRVSVGNSIPRPIAP